ncbi:MAG: helix-turn-helix domain-containing protein [Gammaproteobacteria bacterium]
MLLPNRGLVHNGCWPSVSTVATKCCVSIRTVRRVMQKLVKRGLLLSEQRYRKDGSCSSNRYRLQLEGGDNLTPAPDSRDTTPGQGCEPLSRTYWMEGAGRWQAESQSTHSGATRD